jgi:hypothetical protein
MSCSAVYVLFNQMPISTSFICTYSISRNMPPLAAAQEKYAALATFLKRNKQHLLYFRREISSTCNILEDKCRAPADPFYGVKINNIRYVRNHSISQLKGIKKCLVSTLS